MGLNIPLVRGRLKTTLSVGLASFKKPDGDHRVVEVPVRRLDECELTNVAFIKIDVEGHEERAIVGAKQTIARDRPVMLIEIENRHLYDSESGIKDVRDIVALVESFGYECWFLTDGELLPFTRIRWLASDCGRFETARYGDRYIYNFIFKPRATSA
jgi:hypothetical protein